ncbi:MAG: DUF7033 domain-containing protein, partial [Flavicella sp.]
MILVYTHKITPRFSYIFKHIFVRILNIPVSFTTKVEEFVAYNGMKMNYSKQALGSEFFVKANNLLFEQGINDIEISVSSWGTAIPCFFNVGLKSAIPYDIFAASFYLISRYEEYLPHVRDEHECFPVEESLAYQHDFLKKPLVDIWAYKFFDALKERFPDQETETRSYQFISSFDVNQAFIYRSRGVVRTLTGFVVDFFTLNLSAFFERIWVLLKIKKDPYDTYDEIIRINKKYSIQTFVFFLISNATTYDNNISITKNRFF